MYIVACLYLFTHASSLILLVFNCYCRLQLFKSHQPIIGRVTSSADALVRSQLEGPALPVAHENPDGDELVVFDTLAILPQFVVEVTLKK